MSHLVALSALMFLLVPVDSTADSKPPRDRGCVGRCGSEFRNGGVACNDEALICISACELSRELSQTVLGCIIESRDSGAITCLGAITIVEAHTCAKICVNKLADCREACGKTKRSCETACPNRTPPNRKP